MKVLAFGDSFVKMFIHCKPEVKHFKFKGKSVKGLVKEDDLERKRVQKQIRKAPNGTQILLIFGQVDFNYVRYFKVIKGQPPITQQTFKKYVQWVSSMNFKKNISIVSIFPTPVRKQRVINSLINKGSYLIEQQTPQLDQKILAQFDKSQQTWYLWNSWISSYCNKYKVNNIRLFEKNYLQPQFYDLSQLTIHLRYVPVLKLMKKYIDFTFDASKAEQIQKEYQVEKADRIANSILRMESSQTQGGEKFEEGNGQTIQRDNLPKQQYKQSLQKQQSPLTNQLIPKIITPVTSAQAQEQIPYTQTFQKQPIIQNKRKHTADLDTDTNLEKESERSKQIQTNQEKEIQVEDLGDKEFRGKQGQKDIERETEREREKQRQKKWQPKQQQPKKPKYKLKQQQKQKQKQSIITSNPRSSSNQPAQQPKNKNKQSKKPKKQKKKYICIDPKQDSSQDQSPERLLQLLKNRKKA